MIRFVSIMGEMTLSSGLIVSNIILCAYCKSINEGVRDRSKVMAILHT